MELSDHEFETCLQALPKVELHNHLEGGAMYPDLALRLAARNGMSLPFHDVESAAAYYQFTSLDQFIDILRTTVATLNTAEDYADAVERHGIEARKQNIRYHELFFTYGLVAPRGVALEHVELAAGVKSEVGIVGLGLDCQERGYPARRLKSSFDAAKSHGFRLTAHAGEDGGAESVWDALNCGVERIDHGVQSVEDPALLSLLAERQVLLTVCPISNIALKVFPSMQAHTLPALVEAGIPVCLNSDDPPMFDCNLMREVAVVKDSFSFSQLTLVEMLRNAIVHSFQQGVAKKSLLAEFDAVKQSYFGGGSVGG